MLLTVGNGIENRSEEDVMVSRNLSTRFRTALSSNETYKWMLEDLHIPSSFQDSMGAKEATLKLWLLDKMDSEGKPLCLRSSPLFEKLDEETITSFSVNEDAMLYLFGCQSGAIYYFQVCSVLADHP